MCGEISQQDAIERARKLIARKGIEITDAEPEIRSCEELWAVVFDLALPEDVIQEPSCAIVDVNKVTGVATLFPTL
jgi:hypothetical protein